jgi:hypothetical protein
MADSLSTQVDEIAAQVKQLEASQDALSRAERLRLVQSLESLTQKLKDPKDAIFDHLTNVTLPLSLSFFSLVDANAPVNQASSLFNMRGLLELDVPQNIPRSGGISATDLAAKTGADRSVIGRRERKHLGILKPADINICSPANAYSDGDWHLRTGRSG